MRFLAITSALKNGTRVHVSAKVRIHSPRLVMVHYTSHRRETWRRFLVQYFFIIEFRELKSSSSEFANQINLHSHSGTTGKQTNSQTDRLQSNRHMCIAESLHRTPHVKVILRKLIYLICQKFISNNFSPTIIVVCCCPTNKTRHADKSSPS